MVSALSKCLLEESSAIKLAADKLDTIQVDKAIDLLVSCFKINLK